jgi:hypothetical protein
VGCQGRKLQASGHMTMVILRPLDPVSIFLNVILHFS